MATMLFDRIVPAGKNAYFPFQLSAAGLNPVATVYVANDATGADTALQSGVSVDDMGGGLYAVKVAAGNMSVDGLYYGVVAAGDEFVRLPLWAFAPTKHIAEVLTEIAAIEASLTTMQSDVSAIKTEIGNVSGASWTGLNSAPLDVAAALSAIFAKAKGVQDDLDNSTDGLGALKGLIDTATGKVDAVKSVVDANKGLLESQTYGLNALLTEINANETKIDTVSGNVDTIKSAVQSTTYGLSALKDLIDSQTDAIDSALSAVQGDVTDILADTNELQSAWVNGGRLDNLLDRAVAGAEAAQAAVESQSFGVSAIKSAVDGVGTTADAIQTEIGDVGLEFGQNGPQSVAAALKKIYSDMAAGDVWDDVISGYASGAGYELHQAFSMLGDSTYGLSALSTRLGTPASGTFASNIAAIKAETASIQSDTTTLKDDTTTLKSDTATLKSDTTTLKNDTTTIKSRIGTPVGASLSADIAAIKSVVDTLQVQVNAIIVPAVPDQLYSRAADFRFAIGLAVTDGKTGALEDPDAQGSSPAGKVFMRAKNLTAGTAVALYDAQSGGAGLVAADSAAVPALNGWLVMPQVVKSGNPVVGSFQAFAVIPAYHRDTVAFDFQCKDGDPSGAPATFMSTRYMKVLSPIGAGGGGFF